MKDSVYLAVPLEDEVLGKSYDIRLMRRLFGYLRPEASLVVISLLGLVAGSLLQLVGPYLTKVAIDEYILPKKTEGLAKIAILYMFALMAGFLFQYLRIYLLQLTGQRVMLRLRMQIFDHLLRMPHSFFDKTPVGRLVTRAIHDVEVINELFTQGVIVIFGDVVLLAGISAILFWMNWRLALVVLSVTPLVILATALYRAKARDAYRGVRRHLARLNAYLQENLSGMTTVQTCCREQENFRRFMEMNGRTRDQHLRSITYSALFFPCVELVASIALGLVIWYGGGGVIQGTLLPGVLVAFIQYIRRFFQPVRDLAEKYNILQAAMASSERVFKILDAEPEIKGDLAISFNKAAAGEVIFRDVWFSYHPGEWVLKGISFVIEPSETVALVGATGEGKSSLISLMDRAYEPQRGEIFIDGMEIRQWEIPELRRLVGIIPQEVFLFSGPLIENLRLWNPAISVERIRSLAKTLKVDDFIQSLPKGYYTEIGERGENLSLGQRQLLAFLRAMLYEPRILILDEATSSIDPFFETLLQQAMDRIVRDRTALIIAHRLSTIKKADRILVLQGGRLQEQGAHEELIARNGIYYRLYRLQLEGTPGLS